MAMLIASRLSIASQNAKLQAEKRVQERSVAIHESLLRNFGVAFHALPSEAIELLGVACDEAEDGEVFDREGNHYCTGTPAKPRTYVRYDHCRVSTNQNPFAVRTCAAWRETRLLVPDGCKVADVDEDPRHEIYLPDGTKMETDGMQETIAAIDKALEGTSDPDDEVRLVFTVPCARVKLKEDDPKDLYNREALFQHSHLVENVCLGASITIAMSYNNGARVIVPVPSPPPSSSGSTGVGERSQAGPSGKLGAGTTSSVIGERGSLLANAPKSVLLDEARQEITNCGVADVLEYLNEEWSEKARQEASDWKILWSDIMATEEVKKKDFPARQTGPVCSKGHPMFLLTLSEIMWDKKLHCKACGKPTRFGIQTCKKRCEIQEICQKCDTQMRLRKTSTIETQEEEAPRHTAPGHERGKLRSGFPQLESGECCVLARLRVFFNIKEDEYNQDPYEFDMQLCEELSSLIEGALHPTQLAVVANYGNLTLEVVLLHPVLAEALLPESRHERPHRPEHDTIEFSYDLQDMFHEVRKYVRGDHRASVTVESDEHTDEVPEGILGRSVRLSLVDVLLMNDEVEAENIARLFKVKEAPTQRMVYCSNGCGQRIKDRDLQAHKQSTCPKRRIACTLGCGEILFQQDLLEHVENLCPKRPVICVQCGETVLADILTQHMEEECPKSLYICPLCKEQMFFESKQRHHESECPCREVQCGWCQQLLEYRQLPDHKWTRCVERQVYAKRLFTAVWRAQVELCVALLEDRANPNLCCHQKQWSALHAAASMGQAQICGHLLSFNAHHDQADNDGMTPLHVAALQGQAEAAEVLANNGAEIDASDNFGRSPLFLAAFHGHRDAADVLIKHGASTGGADIAAFGRTWDQLNHGGERPGRRNVSAVSELPALMPSNLVPMKSPLRKSMQLGHDFKWIQMGGIRTLVPKPIPMYATTSKFSGSHSKSTSSLPKLGSTHNGFAM
jgi:hypothetical protein